MRIIVIDKAGIVLFMEDIVTIDIEPVTVNVIVHRSLNGEAGSRRCQLRLIGSCLAP